MPEYPETHVESLQAANTALHQRVAALEAEVACLRQRQHLVQAIVEATSDAVFVKDRAGHYLLVNPAFAALLHKPVADIISRDDFTLFPQAMAHRLRADDQQVLTTGLTQIFEEVGTSTGTTRIYSSAKGVWRDAHGTIQGVIGISREITRQKQMEAALRDSEARYRRLVDLAPEAIVVHCDGHLVFVNPAAVALLGATRTQQLLGRSLFDMLHPASHILARTSIQALQAEGHVAWIEAEFVRLDGQVISVEVAGVAIVYENAPAMQTVIRDMTARKRAEALQAGRARVLELLATGAPLATTLTTLINLIEAQAPAMLGSILLLDDTGRHLRHGAAPSLPPVYTEAVDGMAIGPGAGSCGTAAYRRAPVIVADITQDPLWNDFRAFAMPHGLRACWSTPILASTGAVLGTFAMYYREPRAPTDDDLQLIAMSTHLAGLAIERTRTEEALRQAQRLAALGTFAAGIAHEINNPVGMILLAADNATGCQPPPAVQPFLETIIAQSERCAMIVRSLLQFARQEPTEKWPGDLNALIHRAVDLMHTEATRHGVQLTLTLDDALPAVALNPVAMEHVLTNLLRNAIEAQAHLVHIQTLATAHTVRCCVQDDGHGLTAEARQRLFDPFFTTRRQAGGTGLGLSLSYGIIQNHGGTITVQSPPTGGTTLTIELPVGRPGQEEAQHGDYPHCRR